MTETGKSRIETTEAPAAAWAFSQGVRKGGLLQVSGQGPQDPATGEYIARGDVRAQTTRVLQNIAAVLAAGGGGFDDLIMVRVYLTTRDDFAAMNEAYSQFLSEHISDGVMPCRTTVFVELPHEAMLVEIDALAVLGG